MTREEILKKAKTEKNINKEYEDIIEDKSTVFAAGVGIIFAMILVIVKWLITSKIDTGIMSVAFFLVGSQYTFEGFVVKRKLEYLGGICMIIVAMVLAVIFIGGLK